MYDIQGRKTSELLNRYAAGERHFQRADVSKVSSNQAPLLEAPTHEVTETNAQLLLIPMCLAVIAWAVIFSRQSGFWKTVGNKRHTIKRCDQIPCSSCRFFKNEPYLKCAVHPLKVSRADAINCPDFLSLDSNKFYH